MTDIVALLRAVIKEELLRYLPSLIGVIEKADGQDREGKVIYACDVRLKDRDLVLFQVPLLTDHIGTVKPPAVGQTVLINFVAGDPDQPVIVGSLYSEENPPAFNQGEMLTYLPSGVEAEKRVEMLAKGGENGSRSWMVSLPSDVQLSLTDQKVAVCVGKLNLLLDGENQELTAKTSGGTITIAENGDITIEGNGNLTLHAQGNVEVKAGGNLKLEGTGTTVLKGSVVNIN